MVKVIKSKRVTCERLMEQKCMRSFNTKILREEIIWII